MKKSFFKKLLLTVCTAGVLASGNTQAVLFNNQIDLELRDLRACFGLHDRTGSVTEQWEGIDGPMRERLQGAHAGVRLDRLAVGATTELPESPALEALRTFRSIIEDIITMGGPLQGRAYLYIQAYGVPVMPHPPQIEMFKELDLNNPAHQNILLSDLSRITFHFRHTEDARYALTMETVDQWEEDEGLKAAFSIGAPSYQNIVVPRL